MLVFHLPPIFLLSQGNPTPFPSGGAMIIFVVVALGFLAFGPVGAIIGGLLALIWHWRRT